MKKIFSILLFCFYLKSHSILARRSFLKNEESLVEEAVYNFRPPSHFQKNPNSNPNPGKYQHHHTTKIKYSDHSNPSWTTEEEDTEEDHASRPPLPKPSSTKSSKTPSRSWTERNRPYYGHPPDQDSSKHDHRSAKPKHRTEWQKNNFRPAKPAPPSLPPNAPPKETWSHVHSHHRLHTPDSGGSKDDKVTTLWSISPHGGYALTEEKKKGGNPRSQDWEGHADDDDSDESGYVRPASPPPTKSTGPRRQHQNWYGPGVTPPPYHGGNGGSHVGKSVGSHYRPLTIPTKRSMISPPTRKNGGREEGGRDWSRKKEKTRESDKKEREDEEKEKAWGLLAQRDEKTDSQGKLTTRDVDPLTAKREKSKKEKEKESGDY